MPNGNGDMAGLPQWAKTVLTLVLQHGAAVAIALFLVWFLAQRLLLNQDTILMEIRQHRLDSGLAGRTMTDFATKQNETQNKLIELQLQTCLNTAKTDLERRDCAKASR